MPLVRWLHVSAAAVILGGAVLLATLARARSGGSDADLLRAARTYEFLFWGALGLVVLTGVGNLGALAPALSDPSTRWGRVLTLKLLVAAVFVVASLLRTLAVVRLSPGRTGRRVVLVGAAATAGALAGLVALAEVLAHG